MRSLYVALLLGALLLLVPGCNGRHPSLCEEDHHVEPPFVMYDKDVGPPGPQLVFGTADFQTNGSVLIKIQVEDHAGYAGNEAAITAWSGNGSAPADDSQVPPPGGTQVYSSSGDVHLRHWTTHLDRTYEPDDDAYWLFVHVDHNDGMGNREIVNLRHEWTPSTTPVPDDPVHEFLDY